MALGVPPKSKVGKKVFPPDVPMPEGFNKAKVVWARAGSSKSGKTQFRLKWEDDKLRSAWQTITVSPESEKAMEVFYQIMASLGFTPVMLNDDAVSPDAIADGLVGAEATVRVENEVWEGKTFTKVKWIESGEPF